MSQWSRLLKGIGFAGALGAGMTAVEVGEYALSFVPWVACGIVVMMFLWPRPEGTRGIFLRTISSLCGLACILLFSLWTYARKGDEPWTNLAKLEMQQLDDKALSQWRKKLSPPVHGLGAAGTERKAAGNHTIVEQMQGVVIRPIFKNSPAFTEQRKARISHHINGFYDYLVRVGFEVPKEMPPLGVGKEWSFGKVLTAPKGTIYDAYLYIPAHLIDQREMVIQLYSYWIFAKFFPEQEGREFGIQTQASWLYSDYYKASFLGKHDYAESSGSANWEDALWDIRSKYGQEFSDKLLLYSYKRWVAPTDPTGNLDSFYWDRLMAGLNVVDNDGKIEPDIIRILETRGIRRPK